MADETQPTKTTFQNGEEQIAAEYDKAAFRLSGKDGSVTIPLRMLHLVVETMEVAMERADDP